MRSEYFRKRKKDIIYTYTLNLKTGKIIQNAENLVIVGSPYAMLLYGATGNEDSVDEDNTFCCEENTIQCYTERFEDDNYLAFFRSPFNSKNNLTYLHNTYDNRFKKYFNFGQQIIAVNMISTDFQDKNNGSDQDSDSGYTTNQPDIVEHARKCVLNYPTIVNNIPKSTNKYNNSMDDFAMIDNGLSNSQRAIGESSNLAQISQTYMCNFDDNKYIDYVCILSVLAQVAIDNSKRQFNIDLNGEIRRIRNDMNIKENGYPVFWSLIQRNFQRNKIHYGLHCPMNFLYELELQEFHPSTTTLPMSYFFIKHSLDKNDIRRKSFKVEELISRYSLLLSNNLNYDNEDLFLLKNDFDNLIRDINCVNISYNYIGLFSWLIDRAFLVTPSLLQNNMKINLKIDKNKSILIKSLYTINKNSLLKCFKNG